MKILLSTSAGARAKYEAAFAAALPQARFFWRDAADTAVNPHAEQADYAIVWKPAAAVLAEQRSLQAVFNLGAGVDALLALPSLPADLPLFRLEDAGMAQPMARYALAAVMRHELRFDTYAVEQAQLRWSPAAPRQAATMKVGVLGLGAIGGVIARTLVAAGYSVRGYSRSPRALDGVACLAGSQLDEFFTGLDALVSILPLTRDTEGLLNRQRLSRLAHGAHLVNLGRGAHLVDADLIALLDSGQLGGATLDVFATEPLPCQHPFWSRPEILITPHVSGLTPVDAAVRQVAAKLLGFVGGAAVSGQVDRQRGY
ncbi:MAG: glyoxylate/hydroxypyruvate reductase A [Burkholderiaceae bacterium]